MVNIIRIGLMLAGAYVAYNGYQNGKSAPVPDIVAPDIPVGASVQILSTPSAPVPIAPTNPAVANASLPAVDVLLQGSEEGAWKWAHVYRGWKDLIARRPAIKTTTDFHRAYVDASLVLLNKHQAAKESGVRLNPIAEATLIAAFQAKGLTEADDKGQQRIKAMPWNDQCSQAAEEAFSALSFQAFEAFLRHHSKEPEPSEMAPYAP